MMDFRQLSLPDAPVIKTVPPGPKSKEFLDFQASSESSAVSYPKGLPMAIESAKGATVVDVDGNVYIDFFGGAGVLNVGHSNPQVIEAALKQISAFTHSLDVPNPARRSLVEILKTLLPGSLDKLFFGGPTGSAGALSLTSSLGFKEDFLPLLSEVHFVPYAYCYRCAFGRKPETCEVDCAKYLEHVLEDPHSGVGKPSAVIVEAIQGEGGSVIPHDLFIPKVREICDKYDVLLIVDEIQAGFCRTGKMFSFEHTGVIPDIVTMSKALGGVGFPISGMAFKQELDTWPPGKHIGTFRGNVVAYAAGHAALQFMVANNLAEHASELGQSMLSRLKEIEKESGIVGEARGKGLMLGVELVHDKASKKPAPEFARQVRTFCHQNGLLIEIGGHYDNVARFLPPLVITEDLARKGLEIFADAITSTEKSR
jgi:diaminobutyrate-2-oxoglutarate transaminase